MKLSKNNSLLIIATIILLCGIGLYFIKFSSKRVTNNLPSFTDNAHNIQFKYPTISGLSSINFSDNSHLQYFEARYAIITTHHAWYIIEQGTALPEAQMTWDEYKKQQTKIMQEDNSDTYSNVNEITLGGEKALTFNKTVKRFNNSSNNKPGTVQYLDSKIIQTIHNGKQYIIRFLAFIQAADTDNSIASAYDTFVSSFHFLK